MAKLREYKTVTGGVGFAFYCPGCKMDHSVVVAPAKNGLGASWSWNGDSEKPTFSPSLGTFMGTSQQCHLFVRDGMIEFLSDCHHVLAGQMVPMEDAE